MSKWVQFALIYLVGTLIALSQLKITPVIQSLSDHLEVSLTDVSLLTSIFTLSGIFIAIPGGTVVTWLGARKTLLLLLMFLAAGNFLGAISPNFGFLLATRVLEGISFATIVMTAIVLISTLFKGDSNRSIAIGIFTTFPAMGSFIALNLFEPLSRQYGHFASWYLIGSLSIILLILCYLVVRVKKEEEQEERDASESGNGFVSMFKEAIKQRSVWFLAIMQGCMAFVLFTYIAIYPIFFTNYYDVSLTNANFYASLFGLFGLPFGIIAGYLINYAKNPKWVIFLAFILLAISCLMAPYLNNDSTLFIVQLFLLSTGCSLASSSVMIVVPDVVRKPALIGYSVSLINLFYYSCIVFGAPITTRLIETGSWKYGLHTLTAVAAVGAMVAFTFLVSSIKVRKAAQSRA